jgi:hypothetical protein
METHLYNGTELRAALTGGLDPEDDFRSEEWIFPTNRAITPSKSNPSETGLSRVLLPSGEGVPPLDRFLEETVDRKPFGKCCPTLGILARFGSGDGVPVSSSTRRVRRFPTPLRHYTLDAAAALLYAKVVGVSAGVTTIGAIAGWAIS